MANPSFSAEIISGTLTLNGEVVDIGSLHFVEQISAGASGVVFLAIDTILERLVAVKFWMKLRRKDTRDKNTQGLKEVRKLRSAQEVVAAWKDSRLENPYFIPDPSDVTTDVHKIVGQVYFAGYWNDLFYTVMEYIAGQPLAKFLQETPGLTFGTRYHIALKLNQYNRILLSKDISHGDLHANNIMVQNYEEKKQNFVGPPYHVFDLKIIDFGTSYFTGELFSLDRTFRTLQETIDKCIAPFRLADIQGHSKEPDPTNYQEMAYWIDRQLFALRAAFYELGETYVGWPLYYAFGSYQLTTKGFDVNTTRAKELIRKYADQGLITLSKDFLGVTDDWDTFNGETAVRKD